MGTPAWEVIPDDVLVPRRTARRHRVVASDVQLFSRRGRTPADIGDGDAHETRPAASVVEAGSREKRARDVPFESTDEPWEDEPSPKTTTPGDHAAKPSALVLAESENPASKRKPTQSSRIAVKKSESNTHSASREGDARVAEPVSHGALAAMDEGMARAHKKNRKRARDAQTLLRRAVSVKDVKFFNRLIRDFGNDKQFGFAEEAFRRVAECPGLARNVYSYTNMLNACVRVGELEKARDVWKSMVSDDGDAKTKNDAKTSEKIHPNEVTYTVFIKGLAREGFLDEAVELIETEMCGPDARVRPNVRTFSTLLRNCVRHADGVNADRCFEAMRGAGVEPDAASFEYLVKTKCAAFDAVGAWAAHAEMERAYLEATPQALAALATVSSITGDAESARRACAAAKAAIEANGAGVVSSRGSDGDTRGSFDSLDDAEEDDAFGDAFFCETRDAAGMRGTAPSASGTAANESVCAFLRLRNSDAARQVAEVETFLGKGEALVAAVAADVRRGHASPSSPVKVVEGEGPVLDFSSVFPGKAADPSRPTKLEVCSGMGDWVVSRAEADREKSDWLALEMRHNRVRMTWAKGVRARLSNLALLRGMAHGVLSSRVPADSLAEIFVNYPDPPEWVGSAQCLVDSAFLRLAHRALVSRRDVHGPGFLTMVTDDAGYAMRACRELSRLKDLFVPTAEDGKPFVAGVPEGYGGSYFDEMWKNGRQTDRYYMRYRAEK